jgi:DNA-binding MarR family transcriptional regulator
MALHATTTVRTNDIDAVATTLLGRTSRLTRLLMRTGTRELSRTEAGMLSTLAGGPRTITELAETEALAQPSVSKLVDRLQRRGYVARQRGADDGRVVLVSLTAAGSDAYAQLTEHLRDVLRGALRELPPGDVATLLAAGAVLDRLIHRLHNEGTPK